MQVYNPYSHYFGAYSHFIFQNPLDTTTFSKIFTILKEVAPCDPTVVMADGDGAIRAAVFPDALMAMCWFHCKRACKRNLGKYPSWSCSHFFCLSQASWKASSHTSSRMYWKTWNSSEIMSLILPILFFSVGKESHSWFPDPLLQEDVRVIEDSQWLLARIHSTTTSDKQPSGKVRVSFSHYFVTGKVNISYSHYLGWISISMLCSPARNLETFSWSTNWITKRRRSQR